MLAPGRVEEGAPAVVPAAVVPSGVVDAVEMRVEGVESLKEELRTVEFCA